MNLLRPTRTFGWPLTAIMAMALVLLPVSGVVRSDEPVAPSIEQQPLFKAAEDGYFNYRIPSLVVTTQGTVLALCEARQKTGHDWDDVDLALRRSTDHGRTWSKMQIIADEGELTLNQPCPVVDHQTGTIWLPLCRGRKPGLGNAEVLLMKSTDDGQTWSRPVSIHQTAADPSWTFVGTGPGHGIQLKSGRLLIPCWFDVTPTCGEVQSSCCIYSDDHGETWKRGEPLTRNASDECDIVELEDGTVYLNARSRGQKQRAYAFSKDGGHSWSAVEYDPQQPEPSCDGALIRLSDSRRMDKSRVLVACPTNPDTRAHIRVRMSYDECRTWPIASEPLAHLGGYSDLAVTGDRKILCLYETWPSYKEFGENRTNLVLANFNVEWLSAAPGVFHTYRVLAQGGKMTLSIDGVESIVSDKADHRVIRSDWTPLKLSPYLLAFGNEPTFLSSFELTPGRGEASVDEWEKRYQQGILDLQQIQAIPPIIMLNTMVAQDQVTPRATGHSVWKRIETRFDDPITGVREQSWHAARDGFPDQYMLDRVLEVDASIGGGDQGYSGWTETEDGRIFVVNYTDDTAPACLATPNWPTGLPWIRGTFLSLDDLPPVKSQESK